MSRTRSKVHPLDGLLYALGVLGFFVFFYLLPKVHLDAGADYTLGSDGARQAATDFLRAHGYDAEGLAASVSFRRHGDLLDSLQQDLTRPGAISFLKGDTAGMLPAYYWQVEWYRSGIGAEDSEGSLYRVLLNEHGRVWDFEKTSDIRSGVDRNALLGTLKDPTEESGPVTLPEVVTDSLLRAALVFSDDDSMWRGAPLQHHAFAGGQTVLDALQPGATTRSYVQLGPDWAVALARHHLMQSAFGGYDFRVDSVWVVSRIEGEAARVRFIAELAQGGESIRSDVEVSVTGALLQMDSEFNAPVADAGVEKAAQAETSVDLSFGTVSGITYFVLVVVFLFLFLRRLHARAIDVKVALRDALWGGILAAGVVALAAGPEIMKEMPNLWLGIFITAFSTLLTGAGGAIVIFIVSNAADSITREAWPEKLESLTLARLGYFRNIPVGRAFLRGVALCGIVLGLIVVGLAVFPEARLSFSDGGSTFLYEESPSVVGFLFSTYGYGSLLMTLLVLGGVGTLLYRWRESALVVIPGLVGVFLLILISPVEFATVGYSLAFAGAVGTTLAVAYWYYDLMACLVGYLLVGIFWGLAPGWIIPASPLELDTWIALALLGMCVMIGLVGIVSRKSGAELPNYVPSYVQALAQEERLKGELEIAHVVQESFLPRRMPKVEGLDVAGMCLPAQEVGGDYYDFVELGPGRLGLVVGDVSGKGIQAAFYMTLVKGFFITLSRVVDSPAEVLRRLNTLFCENAPRGMFISLIYGIIDAESKTFTFARAGHNPVIIKRSPSQEPEMVQPKGMAIGLVSGSRFDDSIEEAVVHLRSGDVLVLYTDGFSEAMNAAKQQYGDARLARKVSIVGQRSATEILRAVSEDVHHFLEAVGRHDDMTMVVVKLEHRTGHIVSTSVRKEVKQEGQLELET